jgi:DNA-binding response OmpR family regulator
LPARVLVIDDDIATTELLRFMLTQESFDVYTANNAEEGLGVFRENHPDLVVLDLLLPDRDGWRICQDMRAISKVPILILSALDRTDLMVKALDQGADDFLVKPVSKGVFIAHMNMLLRRSQAELTAIETNDINKRSILR